MVNDGGNWLFQNLHLLPRETIVQGFWHLKRFILLRLLIEIRDNQIFEESNGEIPDYFPPRQHYLLVFGGEFQNPLLRNWFNGFVTKGFHRVFIFI